MNASAIPGKNEICNGREINSAAELTVGVRVQLRVPGEGEGEESHVTQSRKLRPLQLVIGELERAKHGELGEPMKTFDLKRISLSSSLSPHLPCSQ